MTLSKGAKLLLMITLTFVAACGFFFSVSVTRSVEYAFETTEDLVSKSTAASNNNKNNKNNESESNTAATETAEVYLKKNESTSPTIVAIVACSKSTDDWQSVHSTTLHNLLIPSIERTVTAAEKQHVRIDLLIGFDANDVFWNDPKNRNDLQAATKIPISFMAIPKQPKRPQRIPFNEVCQAAYEYGADFIARVNDDSEFITTGWISQSIDRLSLYNPPFVGVVGPTCRQGNTRILTHDFVHRTHLNIFEQYYPDEFDNWWLDDWITYVYGPNRTTKLPEWEMFHHTSKHGQRYQVKSSLKSYLKMTLARGEKQIESYSDLLLLLNESMTPPFREPLLGTKRLAGVWGPIAEYGWTAVGS